MSEWKTYQLSDIADFINGFAFKSGDYIEKSANTLEVFRMGYIQRGGGFKEDSSPVFVPRSYPKNLEKYCLKEGDITIAMTDMKNNVAILGNTAWIRESNRFVLNQRVGCIRVNRNDLIDARYLYYLSNWDNYVEYLRSRANSGVQVNLSTVAIKESEISVPPLPEQKAIAAILSALDDKIELNRRMNETLEAMARAIFKDWFVDFGPTRAKQDGLLAYLPELLWSLFPSAIDPETGLPEGWEASTIGEEVKVVGGSTPSTKEPNFWDGSIAWATPKDLSNLNSPVLLETTRTISEDGLAKISSGLLPIGAVLLSSRAPVGYLAITEILIAVNQGFIAMVCEGRLTNIFVLLWVKENMDVIVQNANGSIFQEISKRNFRPLKVTVASLSVLALFDDKIAPIYRRIANNEIESRTLAETRDRLLPKLMSGEIRVKDAEKMVEEVM